MDVAAAPHGDGDRHRQADRIVDRLADDYGDRFDRATVEAVYSDSLRSLARGARVQTFLPVLAERFTVERLDARARAEGRRPHRAPTVLFVCVHNAGRSQMAAALLRHEAGTAVHVHTAGSDPAEHIQPEVLDAMAGLGPALEHEYPKPLTGDVLAAADVVVTLGCGDQCPVIPGRRYEDWPVADPAGADAGQVAAIRDDLAARVHELAATLLGEPAGPATPA